MLISIKNIKESNFVGSDKPRMLFFLLKNAKILTLMSKKNFVLT